MKRRDFLASSVGLAAAATGLVGCGGDDDTLPHPAPSATTGADGKLHIPWQNWSGYQHCVPDARATPASEDELAELLKHASTPIRPVGAGHSFSPLVPTDGTVLSLRKFSGLLAHDPQALTATFGAGTKIGQIGEPLDAVGQALQNMPDIDEQSLAGAIATGTHGTGANLGALHSFVTELRLVTPRGEVIDCSRTRHPEIFDAARVSLGSLGVVTRMTLQNVASHRMKRRTWMEPLDQLLERFEELVASNHSFEMYFIPFCNTAVAIAINPTDEPLSPRVGEPDNDAVLQLKQLRDFTSWSPALRRWLMDRLIGTYPGEESVDVWHKIFPSNRAVRFNEMEYHMAREHLLPTFHKVRKRIETNHPEEFFPVEIRVVRGDDAWLSPFHGHESASIAVHRYFTEDPQPYFTDIEPLYQDIGGRPHWGKMHTLGAAALSQRYARWKDFLAVREALDPDGKMLNPHLRKVFGIG